MKFQLFSRNKVVLTISTVDSAVTFLKMSLMNKSLLTKDFQDWPAFKTGIIDASGNLLKTARSSEEKDSYTRLDAVLRPVKVALNKFPGGVTMLARAYLMKGFLYESDDKLRNVATGEIIETTVYADD